MAKPIRLLLTEPEAMTGRFILDVLGKLVTIDGEGYAVTRAEPRGDGCHISVDPYRPGDGVDDRGVFRVAKVDDRGKASFHAYQVGHPLTNELLLSKLIAPH